MSKSFSVHLKQQNIEQKLLREQIIDVYIKVTSSDETARLFADWYQESKDTPRDIVNTYVYEVPELIRVVHYWYENVYILQKKYGAMAKVLLSV